MEQQQTLWQLGTDDPPTPALPAHNQESLEGHQLRHQQGDNRWYTDPLYPDLARRVMGGIDLDPASDIEANEYIKAERFFTEADNGLTKIWCCDSLWLNAPGKVFVPDPERPGKRKCLNPDTGGQDIWQKKLLYEYAIGNVKQAVMLIFNASGVETNRIQEQLKGRFLYCEVKGRINFIPPAGKYEDGTKGSNTQPSAFVYFGNNWRQFVKVFGAIGKVTMIYGTATDKTPLPLIEARMNARPMARLALSRKTIRVRE